MTITLHKVNFIKQTERINKNGYDNKSFIIIWFNINSL